MIEDISPFEALSWRASPSNYTLIAGPCSAETEEQTLLIAQKLKALGLSYYRASLWKPRTRPGGFEGVGYEGINWLSRVQNETGMSVMTEVATPAHIEAVRKAGINHLWIGARTSSSPFVMSEIAEALRGDDEVVVLVKNPINPDIELWEGALLRLHQVGIKQIAAIHRGFSTYGDSTYRNSPIWQIPIELKLRHPNLSIIVDPSHIGGKRALIDPLSRKALEMHFDGLMIETHHTPDLALSDAAQQILPETLGQLIQKLAINLIDDPESPELEHWRAQINDIDRQIIALLSSRQEIAKHIGHYKQQQNMCILQPDRYRELMQEREHLASQLGLSESYIHDLFSRIHRESVELQQGL